VTCINHLLQTHNEDNATEIEQNSTYPEVDFPDRLGPSGKFVQNYRLSDQVQYSVVASRASYQVWSTGLDAGTYFKQKPNFKLTM